MTGLDTRVSIHVAKRRCDERFGTDGAFAIAAQPTRGGVAIFVEVARGAELRENVVRAAPRSRLAAWWAGLWAR